MGYDVIPRLVGQYRYRYCIKTAFAKFGCHDTGIRLMRGVNSELEAI